MADTAAREDAEDADRAAPGRHVVKVAAPGKVVDQGLRDERVGLDRAPPGEGRRTMQAHAAPTAYLEAFIDGRRRAAGVWRRGTAYSRA